jgi:hypothetical protein
VSSTARSVRRRERDKAQLEHEIAVIAHASARIPELRHNPAQSIREAELWPKARIGSIGSIKPHLCLSNLFRCPSPFAYARLRTSEHKYPCMQTEPRIPCTTSTLLARARPLSAFQASFTGCAFRSNVPSNASRDDGQCLSELKEMTRQGAGGNECGW